MTDTFGWYVGESMSVYRKEDGTIISKWSYFPVLNYGEGEDDYVVVMSGFYISNEECTQFIRDHVIGKGLSDETHSTNGWYSQEYPDGESSSFWSPVLRYGAEDNQTISVENSYITKEECDALIRNHILGKGLN